MEIYRLTSKSMKVYIQQNKIVSAVLLIITSWAILDVWKLRWVCDDAFISFRYAHNFARGLGLVYNQGERVEGYTNFLWTIIIAPWIGAGLDPRQFVFLTGPLIFASILFLTFKIEYRLMKGNRAIFIPIATLCMAFNQYSKLFATGGLETSFFSVLLLAGIYFSIDFNKSTLRSGIALLFFCLAALTRPEGSLYYCLAGIALPLYTWYKKTSHNQWLINIIQSHWSYILIFLPYFSWRFFYYGWLFPNTFYAKAMGTSNPMQGFIYTGLYFNSYYVFYALIAIIPILTLLILKSRRLKKPGYIAADITTASMIFFPTAIYIAYYTWSGGGFMFGRFLIPFAPMLYIVISYGIQRSLAIVNFQHKWLPVAIAMLLILASANPQNPFKKGWAIAGIGPEHIIYHRDLQDIHIQSFRRWRNTFRKHNIRIAISGAGAVLGYYIDAPYVLEAAQGLTDAEIAHRHLDKKQGRVGHERNVSLKDMEERKIDIYFGPSPHTKNKIIFPGYEHTPFGLINANSEKINALKTDLKATITPTSLH